MALGSYTDIDDQFVIFTDDEPDAGQTQLSTGERNLWAAVLAVAISDLAEKPAATWAPSMCARLREDALRWIQSGDDGVGSFEFVCAVLNLDIDAMRERLLSLTPERAKEVYKLLPNFNPGKSIPNAISTTTPADRVRRSRARRLREKWGSANNGAKANSRDMNGNGNGQPAILSLARKVKLEVPDCRAGATFEKQEVSVDNGKEHTNGNGNQSELGRLKEMLGKFEAELAQLEAEAATKRAVVESLRAAVEALGNTKHVSQLAQYGNGANTEGSTRSELKPATNGRAPVKPPPATGTLKRIHSELSVTDAIKAILEGQDSWIHQDQITRKVFDVGDDTSAFKRAKQALTSTLSHGAKKGLWKALGDGRWAKNGYQRPEQGDGAIAAAAGS